MGVGEMVERVPVSSVGGGVWLGCGRGPKETRETGYSEEVRE